jgi:hypothetical protein
LFFAGETPPVLATAQKPHRTAIPPNLYLLGPTTAQPRTLSTDSSTTYNRLLTELSMLILSLHSGYGPPSLPLTRVLRRWKLLQGEHVDFREHTLSVCIRVWLRATQTSRTPIDPQFRSHR